MEKNNTQEIWKAIAECNGEYHVSSYGRVKSLKFGKERILKQAYNKYGYLFIIIYRKNYKPKFSKIHRLVALEFIPNFDNKPQVNHKDGNKLNNHIDNLEWATCSENMQHAWDNGLNEKIRTAKSKPVTDILTGKKYNSLALACSSVNEPYMRHAMRIYHKSTLQRFFYL